MGDLVKKKLNKTKFISFFNVADEVVVTVALQETVIYKLGRRVE